MAAPEHYQAKGTSTYFNDGREKELLEFVESKCSGRKQVPVADILKLIDEFGASQKYLMNVGSKKGDIVTSLIEKHKPEVMIELGSYVGYSTLLFADTQRRAGGKQFISFERNDVFAEITKRFVQLAGLDEVVRVVVGSSSENLVAEHSAGRLTQVDVAFIDHYKPAYLRDIKVLESLGLIRKDTLLVADNMIDPGNPPYQKYVRSSPEEKRKQLAEAEAANKDKLNRDQFPSWTASQYDEPYEDETDLPGVPDIVYESKMIESYEPTGDPDGVEVTLCISASEKN